MTMISNESLAQQVISSRPSRVFLAFLIAPLAGPLGIYIGMAPFLFHTENILALVGALPFFYLFAGPMVYFFSILLGLPFFLLLHLTWGVSRNSLVVGWAVVGVVSMIALTGFSVPQNLQGTLILFPFALGGAGVGFAFWWVLSTNPEDRPNERQANRYLPEEDDQSNTPSIIEENWR